MRLTTEPWITGTTRPANSALRSENKNSNILLRPERFPYSIQAEVIRVAVLVITNSNDATADYALEIFDQREIPYTRFNTDKAILEMDHGFKIGPEGEAISLSIAGEEVDLERVFGIWYRRPELPKVARELSEQARHFAEEEAYYYLRCLWKILANRVWVSHPWAISWAGTKLYQLKVAKELGFSIPHSLATNNPEKAEQFIRGYKRRVVVKPFKENVLEYEGQTPTIYTSRVEDADLQHLTSVRHTITFFQEEVEKQRDIRVTVIGNDVFSASIDSQSDPSLEVDWRRTTSKPKNWEEHRLPESLAKKCLFLIEHFGLNFGAIDLVLTPEGDYVFLELNPNGQWAWIEIELGYPMTESLIRLLTKGTS